MVCCVREGAILLRMWQDECAALASCCVAEAKDVHNDVMHTQYLSPF